MSTPERAEKALRRKRRIERRLRRNRKRNTGRPELAASNVHYEVADRTTATNAGGIGAIHTLALSIGLPDAIDAGVHVLHAHQPYHEADPVLNIAYNALSGGTALEELHLRREDEGYLNALGAERIPDRTPAGDFCRRFTTEQLIKAIHNVRLNVWAGQDDAFFEEAKLDVDGIIVSTTGECKDEIGLSYDGQWGDPPLIVSLANTAEPLYLVNRPGNRPSHEGAAPWTDQAIPRCEQAGLWFALKIPIHGRWRSKHTEQRRSVLRMELKQFMQPFIYIPCQIVRTGRKVIDRLLGWNRWQEVFLRAADAFSRPLRC